MAKYYGKIGYETLTEDRPGVWVPSIEERNYSGEVIKNTVNRQSSDQVNDNIGISNTISILSDPYAASNFHAIRYATYMGAKWKVTSVEVQYPRLLLSLGGVYNEH